MTSTLKVISAGAVEFVIRGLAKAFTAETGTSVEFTFNTIAGVRKRLASGESGDIVIGTAPAITEFESAGTVLAGTVVPIGRTHTGICVAPGAPIPDISTPAALKATLLAARSFAYTNPEAGGTSGIFLTGLMERLAILDEMKRKAVLCINGEDVVEKVLSGQAEIGSTFISEFFLGKGVVSVGPLPREIGNATTYAAGLLAPGANRDTAKRFIAMLTATPQRQRWTDGGFEPAA